MRKLFALAVVLLVAGCTGASYIVREDLGGKYDAKLILENITTTKGARLEVLKVLYTLEGRQKEGMLPEDILPAFEKIKQDTPQNATIVLWWDYASALRGYTGRNVLFDAPSKGILYSVAGGWKEGLAPEERVRDVSSIFVTNSSKEAVQVMGEYSAQYVLVHNSDLDKAFVFYSLPNGDSGEYLRYMSDGAVMPTVKGFQTLFFRMYRGEDIPGFFQFYMDNYTHVYRVDPTLLSS
jgi:hypothetical protein